MNVAKRWFGQLHSLPLKDRLVRETWAGGICVLAIAAAQFWGILNCDVLASRLGCQPSAVGWGIVILSAAVYLSFIGGMSFAYSLAKNEQQR